jgi:hypothetical protein
MTWTSPDSPRPASAPSVPRRPCLATATSHSALKCTSAPRTNSHVCPHSAADSLSVSGGYTALIQSRGLQKRERVGRTNVAVERRGGLRIGEERDDRAAHALQRPDGRPGVFEHVQADLARLWVCTVTTRCRGDVVSGLLRVVAAPTFQWTLGWQHLVMNSTWAGGVSAQGRVWPIEMAQQQAGP